MIPRQLSIRIRNVYDLSFLLLFQHDIQRPQLELHYGGLGFLFQNFLFQLMIRQLYFLGVRFDLLSTCAFFTL